MSERRVVFSNPFYDNELGLFRVDQEYEIPDNIVLPKTGVKYLRGGPSDQPGASHLEGEKVEDTDEAAPPAPKDPRTRRPRQRKGAASTKVT